MTLILHGEMVQITAITCATRGYRTEYQASYAHDGTPMPGHITFFEDVAKAFRKAGHTQVAYKRGHIFEMANVDVVIEDVNNKYAITAVMASNGDAVNVLKVERNSAPRKTASLDELMAKHTDPMVRKAYQDKQVKLNRFKHGEALHDYQRNNTCALIEVNGEYQLVTHNTTQKQVA